MSPNTVRAFTIRHRGRVIPVLVTGLVGVLSLVPSSFPAQQLFETLAIAQASLLAIVISVSMMSMQVSTNRFAPQLSQLYRESSFNAIIARFGLSILLNLALFAVPTTWTNLPSTRAIIVGGVTGVAAWAFVSLLEIEERLLVFLNPDPVLESLVGTVSFDRYHAFSVNRREEGQVARNPILEIFQIAQTSLEQRDNYSALRAIDALDDATERLLSGYAELPAEDQRETEPSVHKLFDYWNRIADLAVEWGSDDVLHAIVDAEQSIGQKALDLQLSTAAIGSVDAVFHFCAVTLANNRLESRYHATLGELLSTSLEAGMLDVARRAVTDIARLSQLVDRRDDDLLVAADERITPHREFFDNWAYFLEVHQPRLETEQCQSLYVHFERQYRSVRDEVVANGRVDDFYRAANPGFRDIGIGAASADVQWAVSRTTEHVLELVVLTEAPPDSYLDTIRHIIASGGAPGVHDALRRLSYRTDGEQGPEGSEAHSSIVDPLTDRLSGNAQSETSIYSRPIRPETLPDEIDETLDTVEALVDESRPKPESVE